MSIGKLILVPAGESIWTEKDHLAGWVDTPLSDEGLSQASKSASILSSSEISFSLAFTSMMKRSIHTLGIILDELNLNWLKIKRHWRLNPQHLGALQTKSKSEIITEYGEDKYFDWIHRFSHRPPQLDIYDERHPRNEIKYKHVPIQVLPASESLEDLEKRVEVYWADKIAPVLIGGGNVLVVTHRSTLKVFKKFLSQVDQNSIESVEILNVLPEVYEFGQGLEVAEARYLS